jgi:hypothetical protein
MSDERTQSFSDVPGKNEPAIPSSTAVESAWVTNNSTEYIYYPNICWLLTLLSKTDVEVLASSIFWPEISCWITDAVQSGRVAWSGCAACGARTTVKRWGNTNWPMCCLVSLMFSYAYSHSMPLDDPIFGHSSNPYSVIADDWCGCVRRADRGSCDTRDIVLEHYKKKASNYY